MAQDVPAPYPVQFSVDHAERQSRWKALFRLPLALPALLFAGLALYTALIALPIMWLAILIRGRIPRWLFDYQVGVERFNVRVQSYFSLLTDVYPAFHGEYPVHYEVAYPERVSRWKVVIWKFAAGLPQWIAVWMLQYASFAIVAVGWLVILFTGQFPKGLHDFVVGVMRWRERVYAYSLSLTDEYPPYSLSAEAPATTGGAYVASSAAGALVVGGAVAGIVALIIAAPFGGEERVVQVSYERLLAGDIGPREALIGVNSIDVELVSALDPADEAVAFLEPQPGYRLVLFSFLLTNDRNDGGFARVDSGDFQMADPADDNRGPLLGVIGRRSRPVNLAEDETVEADIVFEVPEGMMPLEVSFGGGFFADTAVYEFR
jgi:hypothetical protein